MSQYMRYSFRVNAPGQFPSAKGVDLREIPGGNLWVQTTDGAFSSTMTLEVSLDGINFVTSSATINLDGYVVIPEYAVYARIVVPAGALTGHVDVVLGGAKG